MEEDPYILYYEILYVVYVVVFDCTELTSEVLLKAK